MSLTTHIGNGKSAPTFALKGSPKTAIKLKLNAAVKLKAQRKADRTARLATAKRRSAHLGSPVGKTADENVGAWCQATILRSGHSANRIAADAGLSPGTVSKLLYGYTRRPSFNTVMRVLNVGELKLEIRSA